MRFLLLLMVLAWAGTGYAQDPDIDPRKRDSLIQSIEANRKALRASQDSFIRQQQVRLLDSTHGAAGRDQTISNLKAVNEERNPGVRERKERFARLATGLLLLTVLIIVLYRRKKKGSRS